jgi:plasmid maintenance system antidote protein VapI
VRRRKRYPARLGDVLGQNFIARQRGDYHPVQVSQTQAARALARAREFLDAIMNGRG